MTKDDQSPFRRYTRTVLEVREVATVTAENIGQIAALIAGSVDYSRGEPILVVPKEPPWRVKLGGQVSRIGDTVMNQNGFNSDGTWTEDPPPATVPDPAIDPATDTEIDPRR